jgi:hypothetical protein
MDKEHLGKSPFENYKISIAQVQGCPCMGWLKRAVIELSGDISTVMPRMRRSIEGCAYNPDVPVAAFRFRDMGVIVERNKIIINNAEEEATAQIVIDFLKDIVNTSDEIATNVEVS